MQPFDSQHVQILNEMLNFLKQKQATTAYYNYHVLFNCPYNQMWWLHLTILHLTIPATIFPSFTLLWISVMR